MAIKFCYHCEKNKPVSEFDEIVVNSKKCLRGWCKECSTNYKKEFNGYCKAMQKMYSS